MNPLKSKFDCKNNEVWQRLERWKRKELVCRQLKSGKKWRRDDERQLLFATKPTPSMKNLIKLKLTSVISNGSRANSTKTCQKSKTKTTNLMVISENLPPSSRATLLQLIIRKRIVKSCSSISRTKSQKGENQKIRFEKKLSNFLLKKRDGERKTNSGMDAGRKQEELKPKWLRQVLKLISF